MNSTRPKFDQERYDKYDVMAKEAGVSFLCYLYNNPEIDVIEENYMDDLIVKLPELGGKIINVQVEVRAVWKGEKFPFPTFQLPKSKVDNALKRNEVVLFLVFNNDLNAVGVLRVSQSTPKKVVKKLNKFSQKTPESFYDFKLDLVDFY